MPHDIVATSAVQFTFLPDDGTPTLDAPVLDVSVTVDESWTPFCQARITVPLDEALADAIDPTDAAPAPRVQLALERRIPGDFPEIDQFAFFLLAVRGVVRDYEDQTMVVTAASDERYVDTYVHKLLAPEIFTAGLTVDQVVNLVLDTAAPGFIQDFTLTGHVLTEDVAWETGTTAMDFLKPLVDLTGRKLLCDEQQIWRNPLPGDPITTGPTTPVTFTPGELIRHEARASVDDGEYADDTLVVYEWTQAGGTTTRRKDESTASGATHPTTQVVRPDGRYPGAGAGNVIQARTDAWRYERTIRTLWDLNVRPGVVVNLDDGATVTGGKVHRVTFNGDGTQDFTQYYT